jgi:hypothetical protein
MTGAVFASCWMSQQRMNSASAITSPMRSANSFTYSGLVARLNPVPTGSMNTRSLSVSHVSALSTSLSPSPRSGPATSKWSGSAGHPGPPFQMNDTGRGFAPLGVGTRYDV